MRCLHVCSALGRRRQLTTASGKESCILFVPLLRVDLWEYNLREPSAHFPFSVGSQPLLPWLATLLRSPLSVAGLYRRPRPFPRRTLQELGDYPPPPALARSFLCPPCRWDNARASWRPRLTCGS